jgi:hypothetical protein
MNQELSAVYVRSISRVCPVSFCSPCERLPEPGYFMIWCSEAVKLESRLSQMPLCRRPRLRGGAGLSGLSRRSPRRRRKRSDREEDGHAIPQNVGKDARIRCRGNQFMKYPGQYPEVTW